MMTASQQLVFFMVYTAALVTLCYGSSNNATTAAAAEEVPHDRHGFPTSVNGSSLDPAAVLERVMSRSFLSCCTACRESQECGGVAYTGAGECSLIGRTAVSCGDYLEGEEECSTCHYKLLLYDDSVSVACSDLLEQGDTADGVYILNRPGIEPFPAYCDMSDGGWTVIQRRVDDSVDFYRGWDDYVAGFGDLSGNFWAGLDKIHAMTSCRAMELLVTMETFENEAAEARYSSFQVADAASGYRLSVSGYSGTAGDSLAFSNQQRFTTKDHDVDAYAANCAVLFSGAWWYGGCHQAHPNGLYLHGHTSIFAKGIVWAHYKGLNYSLRSIQFKVRRVN